MRVLSLLVVASLVSLTARAQDAPPITDAPAPLDPATLEPLAPQEPVAPVAPAPVVTAPPPPDAKRTAPIPDARVDDGCAVLPAGLGGLAGFAGAALLGGMMVCVGGLMSTIEPTSNSSDCGEACVETLALVLVVAVGVVILVAGIIALGPAAAIAGTVGAALGAAGAKRKVWPSVVGGVPGIVLAIGGIGLATWAIVDMPSIPFIAGNAYDTSDPKHAALVGGIAVAAASGLVSLGGALVAEAVWGGAEAP